MGLETHEHDVRRAGLSLAEGHAAVRIAAVVCVAAAVLNAEEGMAG